MDVDVKYAALGDWLVNGSDGWLAMLEKFTAEGHKLDEKTLGKLKTAHVRIAAVLEQQQPIQRKPPIETATLPRGESAVTR